MSEAVDSRALLPYTFATWVYTLHASGVEVADDEVRGHCEAIAAATDAATGDAAGDALVSTLSGRLGDGGVDHVAAAASALFGDRVATDLGAGSRDERTGRIRTYQFSTSLPWLARIWERHPDGEVGPAWLLIERVTDTVFAMDPNPWNDIDEERQLPVNDFHVLWELDACANLYIS